MSSRLLLAVGLVMGLPALLQAQYNTPQQRNQLQRQQQQQAAMQPVEFQGTIQGIAKGVIMVAANNQVLRVNLLPITKVHVTGTTTAAVLRQGLIVDFVVQIDARGVAQGKVDALTITSLTQERQLGIYPSGEAKEDNVVDGFGAKPEEDPAEAGVKRGKRPPRTSGKAAARTQPAGSYRVIGRLVVGRDGAFSAEAGRGMVSFELADQAKISVDLADFSAVTRGNDVSIKGVVVPGRPPTVQAAEIHVKLPERQAGATPEPPLPPETKKPAKRLKKGKDEPLPEPDADQ